MRRKRRMNSLRRKTPGLLVDDDMRVVTTKSAHARQRRIGVVDRVRAGRCARDRGSGRLVRVVEIRRSPPSCSRMRIGILVGAEGADLDIEMGRGGNRHLRHLPVGWPASAGTGSGAGLGSAATRTGGATGASGHGWRARSVSTFGAGAAGTAEAISGGVSDGSGAPPGSVGAREIGDAHPRGALPVEAEQLRGLLATGR